jgi:hypothetical protein
VHHKEPQKIDLSEKEQTHKDFGLSRGSFFTHLDIAHLAIIHNLKTLSEKPQRIFSGSPS